MPEYSPLNDPHIKKYHKNNNNLEQSPPIHYKSLIHNKYIQLYSSIQCSKASLPSGKYSLSQINYASP